MGRPRKPTFMHLASGSHMNHPERLRARSAEPEAEGEELATLSPPDHLDDALRGLWLELAPLVPRKVAYRTDALAFEVLTRVVAKMRADKANASLHGRLLASLGEFGMTPAARRKVLRHA